MRSTMLTFVTMGITAAAGAQTTPTSERPRAFSFAVVVGPALSFGGIRAYQVDSVTCPSSPNTCIQDKVGSGPMFTAAVQIPLLRNFALSAGGLIGKPARVLCFAGESCTSTGSMTAIRANVTLFARLKPRVPIFFGVGGAMNRFDPGPVRVRQDTITVTETGWLGMIGYDFALGKRVGARITWWHYFMSASRDGLDTGFRTGRPHDSLIAIDARISLGS